MSHIRYMIDATHSASYI